jgi:hypothetical protein
MGIAKGSRKIESPEPAAGWAVLFYAAFAALVRDQADWAHVYLAILPPGRKPT